MQVVSFCYEMQKETTMAEMEDYIGTKIML